MQVCLALSNPTRDRADNAFLHNRATRRLACSSRRPRATKSVTPPAHCNPVDARTGRPAVRAARQNANDPRPDRTRAAVPDGCISLAGDGRARLHRTQKPKSRPGKGGFCICIDELTTAARSNMRKVPTIPDDRNRHAETWQRLADVRLSVPGHGRVTVAQMLESGSCKRQRSGDPCAVVARA